MELGLKNRVVLITGASEGMGQAISRGFAVNGATVVMGARREDVLARAAAEIRASVATPVVEHQVDVERKKDIEAIVDFTVEKFGKIDVLICNSGGPPAKYFTQVQDTDWDKYLNLNLKSFVRLSQAVVPHMKVQKWGRILFLTSVSVKQPIDGLALSNIVRPGVTGLTKTLSNELARYNILVNNVCPGYVRTDHVVDYMEKQAGLQGKTPEEIADALTRAIPLARMAEPDEIADVFVYLASERASYITGVTLQVDGGYVRATP